MKSIVSFAVAMMFAFIAIPHLKYTEKSMPPIEKNLRYDINTYHHELEEINYKIDSIKEGIRKNHEFIQNVVPGAN